MGETIASVLDFLATTTATLLGFVAQPAVLGLAVLLGMAWVASVEVPRYRRRRAYQASLPDLTDMDLEQRDPASSLWRLAPPYGGDWELWAPGHAWFNASGFIGTPPTASHPATGQAADPMAGDPDAEPMSIEQLTRWVAPWIEEVSGGRVVEFVQGWGAPYGPRGALREWVAFARVEDAVPQPGPRKFTWAEATQG
jgi:hypothetical protein